MAKFDAMGKVELRAACKEAGVKYGKMNNDSMRAELRTIEKARIQAEAILAAKASVKSGLKIEKNREERNGVKRPSIGGKCRAIWDAADAYCAETNKIPTIAVICNIAKLEGWEHYTVQRQFYQWRKFNGIWR